MKREKRKYCAGCGVEITGGLVAGGPSEEEQYCAQCGGAEVLQAQELCDEVQGLLPNAWCGTRARLLASGRASGKGGGSPVHRVRPPARQ